MSSTASYLAQAAALQDHFARNLRMNGAGKKTASLVPGSELTLAQRYGLVQRPAPLLTKEEWKEAQEKSRQRQDSCGECAICRDEFRDEDQILLSCSHVFHKQCITAFERFAKQRCCPLCRTEQYQKLVIDDGKQLWRQKCATRIQACYKGHLVRVAYKKLRRTIPYRDPRLKRRWLEERIQEQSAALVKEVEDDRGDLDSFFAELDASVAASKAQMEQAEASLLRSRMPAETGQAGARADSALLAELNPSIGWDPYSASSMPQPPAGDKGSAKPRLKAVEGSTVDWDHVLERADARDEQDCPICLGDLNRKGKQGIAWLSCTHCFHLDCITCFEAFEVSRGGTTSCPVCRSAYERTTMA